jgi:hygromycin-B 7''-O-kinase
MFDFDDALIGYREYDFSSPGLFMMRCRPELLRAFFTAYGLPRSDLNPELSRRLLAYTLLHRYRDFNWILGDLVGKKRIETLDELAQVIYGLE